MVVGWMVGQAEASCGLGGCAVGCGPVCAPAAPCYQTVEKTIMVPTTVMETRQVTTVECVPQVQERTITVTKRVPVKKIVTHKVCVMVPVQHTKTVTYTVCKPIVRDVQQTCTVMVPKNVVKQGVRKVCKRVPVQIMQEVCKDMGHWAEQPCPVPSCSAGCGVRVGCGGCGPVGCGGCGVGGGCGVACAPAPCVSTCKVWVPNIVKEQVPCTVWKTEVIDEPFEYTVTICEPQTVVKTVQVHDVVKEPVTKEVTYTVCEQQIQEKQVEVCTYECVSEPKVIQVTVMVPQTIVKNVQVAVCKLVPKVVQCQVPVCNVGCGSCGPTCH